MGFLVQCSQCGTMFAKGLCPKCGHVEDPDIVERQRWIIEQFRKRKQQFETHRAISIGLFTAVMVTTVGLFALVWKARSWEWEKLSYDPEARDIGAIFGGVVLLIAWAALTFVWTRSSRWWPVELACPGCDNRLDHLTEQLFCPACGVPLHATQALPPPPRRLRNPRFDPAKTPSPASPLAKHRLRTFQRKTVPLHKPTPVEEPEPLQTDKGDTDELLALALTVKEHVESLPAPQQEMLQLRMEGYEPREIAAKTDRSTRTVEWCLQEVRKRLQDMFKAQGT
jgi:hypothetical protein